MAEPEALSPRLTALCPWSHDTGWASDPHSPGGELVGASQRDLRTDLWFAASFEHPVTAVAFVNYVACPTDRPLRLAMHLFAGSDLVRAGEQVPNTTG